MKKYFVVASLFISLLASFSIPASALTSSQRSSCEDVLKKNISVLKYGAKDKITKGEFSFTLSDHQISLAQEILANLQFLSKDSITGYYGSKTVVAVKKYQRSKGISTTGNIGTLTRNAMVADSCMDPEIAAKFSNFSKLDSMELKASFNFSEQRGNSSVSISSDTNAPELYLNVSSPVNFGEQAEITWGAKNVSTCNAGWTGLNSITGSQKVVAMSLSKEYSMTCIGGNGSVSRSVTLVSKCASGTTWNGGACVGISTSPFISSAEISNDKNSFEIHGSNLKNMRYVYINVFSGNEKTPVIPGEQDPYKIIDLASGVYKNYITDSYIKIEGVLPWVQSVWENNGSTCLKKMILRSKDKNDSNVYELHCPAL
jgi:hypothetical protein